MIESILKNRTASHILWLCRANEYIFKLMKNALFHGEFLDKSSIKTGFTMDKSFWRYGSKAIEPIKKSTSDYLKSRIGITIILHQLEEHFGSESIKGSLSSISDITELIKWMSSEQVRERYNFEEFTSIYQSVLEEHPAAIQGKKGIASNINEFLARSWVKGNKMK